MAARLTFDYDLLKELIRDHPDWSNIQYAAKLSEDADHPVRPNSVAAAISRHRTRWAAEGVACEQRTGPYPELIPWARGRVAQRHQMHMYLRYLRTLARHRRGWEVYDEDILRNALHFERQLRARLQVVDLTTRGMPVLRPAEPHELDARGQLIEIVAQPRPASEHAPRRALRTAQAGLGAR